MIFTVLLFGLAAALAEILGGAVFILRKHWPLRVQEFLLALGAGFLLALVFLQLIPASIQTVGTEAALYMLLGFATIHFFEHTVVGHLHFGEEIHGELMISRVAGISAMSGLFIHAFFDGFSISAGMQFDMHVGLLVFLAVLLHKIPEGLTIGSIMVTAGFSRKAAFFSALGIGGATLLGTMAVFLVATIDQHMVGIAFAFSAGVATYVGASDLIPEINKSDNRLPPLVVLAGMVLFYATERWLEGLM